MINLVNGIGEGNVPGSIPVAEELLPAARREGAELLILRNYSASEIAMVIGSVGADGRLAAVNSVLRGHERHPAGEGLPYYMAPVAPFDLDVLYTPREAIQMSNLTGVQEQDMQDFLRNFTSNTDQTAWRTLASLQHQPQQ